MAINSRAKGARTERELSKKLEEVMGWKARRTQQYCGAAGDSDVVIEELPQVFLESKAVEKLNVQAAMDRAAEDAAAEGKIPVLAHKRNRKEWLMTIRLSDMPRLLQMVEIYMSMKQVESERG